MSQFTNINEMSLPKVDQAMQDVSAKLAGADGQMQGGDNDFFVGLVGAALGASAVFEGVQAMMALRQNAQEQAQTSAHTDFLTGKKRKNHSNYYTPAQSDSWKKQAAPLVAAARGAVDVMAGKKQSASNFLGARSRHQDVHERTQIVSSFFHSPSKGVKDKEGMSAKTRDELFYTKGVLERAQKEPSLSAIVESPEDERSKSAFMNLPQENKSKVARTMQGPQMALH